MGWIITKATLKNHVQHVRFFENPKNGWGFSFTSDTAGAVDCNKLNTGQRRNYDQCVAGMINGDEMVDRGHQVRRWSVWYPSVLKCCCGSRLELRTNSNQCLCGEWYNIKGQQLVNPRL